MTEYELRWIESAEGERIGWHLMKNVADDEWGHVATIGALTTADAREWAARWITAEDGRVTWRPDDGTGLNSPLATVFAKRWRASVADVDDEEE